MQIPKEHSKLKTSLLKEFSNLREQQRLQKIRTIAGLPFLNKTPEIKSLLEGFKSKDKNLPVTDLKINSERPGRTTTRRHYTPPYDIGFTTTGNGHPHNILDPTVEMPYTFNPFSVADAETGELSLSAISGQNHDVFYQGHPYNILPNLSLGFYNPACASIAQKVDLFLGYDADSLIEIELKIRPLNYFADAVNFIAEDIQGEWRGLQGAQGYIDIYVSMPDVDSGNSYSSSTKFLDSWKIFESDPLINFERTPTCKLSFKLPAGVSEFWVHVAARIEAHSDLPNDPSQASSSTHNYTLVDFRSREHVQHFPILQDFFTQQDHQSNGGIQINEIIVSSEPYYYNNPDPSEENI